MLWRARWGLGWLRLGLGRVPCVRPSVAPLRSAAARCPVVPATAPKSDLIS